MVDFSRRRLTGDSMARSRPAFIEIRGWLTVHPREGRSEDGSRVVRPGISRRDFLSKVGLGAAAGGLLAACGASSSASGGTSAPKGTGTPLPRPNRPVKWPVFSGNEPIKSGLAPEKGATLQIYNWVAYINEAVVKNFCKKYQCKYQITTFNTMEEAIAKLASGQLKFDIFFPTLDVIGPLVEEKLMRPLNHSYIPNIAQRLVGLPESFLRSRLAVLRPIHDLHHGHRMAEGPRGGKSVHDGESMGNALAGEVQGQGRHLGRLSGGAEPCPDEERHLRPQHDNAHQIAAATQQAAHLQSLVNVRSTTTTLPTCQPARRGSTNRGRAIWPPPRHTCPRELRSTCSATGSRPTGGARSATT